MVAPIDARYAAFMVFARWFGSSKVRTTIPSASLSQRIVVRSGS